MIIGNIYSFLNNLAPFDTQFSFDNSGLIIGDLNTKISNILICLDITSEVLEKSLNNQANLIISHHPIIFDPIKKINTTSLVYKLIEKKINVLSIHTNLDIAKKIGVNISLFNQILGGISEIDYESQNNTTVIFANLNTHMYAFDIASILKSKLNCDSLRFFDSKKIIKRIALVCGSGGSFIKNANEIKDSFDFEIKNAGICNKNQIDAFITGEIKHSDLVYAINNDISIFDIGHFSSEFVIVDVLYKLLKENFKSLNIFKFERKYDWEFI